MPEPDLTRKAIDPFSRDVLEFAAVVELLHSYLSGPISEPLLEQVEPHTNLDLIRRDLELARETREYLRESPRPSLAALREPRPLLDKLRVEGMSLAALEILALVEVARAALDMHRLFAKRPTPRLAELARALPDFRDLVTELGGKIHPDGTVDSSASPELGRIRRAIERLKAEIQTSLERMLRRFAQEGVLQDAVVTIRNDRFVIPVRVEDKRRVQGVVHGASSSGATVYIEPLETLGLNNELVELQDREFAEIQRILGEFSRKLQARREDLGRAAEILSEIDLAFAKAEFSRQYDCCIPEFHTERALWLHEVRHPLLEKTLRSQRRQPVPLTLELKAPKTLDDHQRAEHRRQDRGAENPGHRGVDGAGGNSRAGQRSAAAALRARAGGHRRPAIHRRQPQHLFGARDEHRGDGGSGGEERPGAAG